MKTTCIFILLFSTIVSYVSAQLTSYFYITNPVQGSIFRAGTTETITWTNGIDQSATVTLLTGSNALTMTSTGVTFTIQGTDGEYDWAVPTTLPQNGTFSLQITYSVNGTSGYSYSSAFAIANSAGQVTNTSSTSVSPIATAIPSTSLPSSNASVSSTSLYASSSATAAISSVSSAISSSSTFVATTASISRPATTLSASTTPTPSVSGAAMRTPAMLIITVLVLLALSFIL